mmetsp:Transcript_17821/g.23329  ORF Transcript_17821/g.23329 Transcript_17821/m.23329 type:complete len:222 (-) Transcript_17821:747-1412(-)
MDKLNLSQLKNGKKDLKKVNRRSKTLELKEVTMKEEFGFPLQNLYPSLEDHVDPPVFEVGDPGMKAYLQNHGYVVVANIANEEQIRLGKELFWDFLNEHAGMKEDDPTTWGNSFYQIGSPSTGIISAKGIGQSEFMWHLRLLPNVKEAFSQIWGANDLLTSFDGANLYRPWHREGCNNYRTRGGWFHVDQGIEKTGLHCVQGMVTLYDATVATGGLCVVPR